MDQPTAGWCTNWDAYDLPRLWQMVAGENDDDGWTQVQAWSRMRGAVDAQRERLQACRQALQTKWPPEQSPAAATFIGYLDVLIASMTETAAGADSTARGLAGIMKALTTAKEEIKPLYDEWQAASSDLTPRWWNHAEDELNTKARTIMRTTEQAVADYTPMIKIPAQYEPWGKIDPGTPFGPADSSPANTGSSGINLAAAPPTGAPWNVPPISHTPPPSLPGIDPLLPGTGPILGGAPAPTIVPPNPPPLIPPGNPGTGTPGGHAGLPPPPITGPLPGRTAIPTAIPNGGNTPLTGRRMTAPRGGTPVITPMPHGTTPGQPGAGTAAARPPATGTPMMAPPNGTANPRQRHTRTGSKPDNPWAADEGVTPVITSAQARPHDPGPGIIGIDR